MGKYRWSMAAVVICSAAAAMAQEAAPLPTAALLKSQVEAGEYRPALQGLTRVLALKGPAAEPYDRLEMLMLRAECQLQLRAAAPALEALTQAQKEAVTRGDADKLGEVSAMMLLIQRSPAMRYTPKQSTGPLAKKPIEILDRGTRKEAYKALFEDELAAARPKVRAAETATRLPPVLEAAKVAGSLRGLEQAATGGEAASKEMTDNLARHAALLVENAVSDMSLKTETIAGRANTVVTSPILHRDPATNQARLVDMSHRRGAGRAGDPGAADDRAGLRATILLYRTPHIQPIGKTEHEDAKNTKTTRNPRRFAAAPAVSESLQMKLKIEKLSIARKPGAQKFLRDLFVAFVSFVPSCFVHPASSFLPFMVQLFPPPSPGIDHARRPLRPRLP